MTGHTIKAFDSDLADLMHMVAEMGGMAEKELRDAVEALVHHNIELARRVIVVDEAADAMQQEIETKAIATIACRQPVADDLRTLTAVLRIATELERVGDLAKNIAKRVIALNDNCCHPQSVRGLQQLAHAALRQLHDVLDGLALHDDKKAMAVRSSDDEIDAIYVSLFHELLTDMMEDPITSPWAMHLLFCAKNIEHIGDHVTHIAEAVHYLVDGHPIGGGRLELDGANAELQLNF